MINRDPIQDEQENKGNKQVKPNRLTVCPLIASKEAITLHKALKHNLTMQLHETEE
jgi:hypothetical protein